MDLPPRRCSFPASNSAANALNAAGNTAPRCSEITLSPVSSAAVLSLYRGNRRSDKNSLLHELRAASAARVSFDGVTIESHDRYSARMTLLCASAASLRQRIAYTVARS